jgi:signal transduction histidine kinase
LGAYLEQYRLQTGVEAVLSVEPELEPVRATPGAEAQLLRIIQEALANVRKHAAAERVKVMLGIDTGQGGPRLRAVVADDGRGFDPATLPAEAHYGLLTMRERAESVGGRLQIDSSPGQGTRITVTLPVETAPSAPREED